MLFDVIETASPWQGWLDSLIIKQANLKDLPDLLTKIKSSGIMSLDIETTGLDPYLDQICLIQITPGPVPANPSEETQVYILKPEPAVIKVLVNLIEDKNVLKIGHNLSFDLKFIQVNTGRRLNPQNLFDTMLASQLVTAGDFIPENQLEKWLEKNNITKVKHGATHYYDQHGHEIKLEKDTAKSTRPVYLSHSLQQVAHRYLEVWLPKDEQTSDWGKELTAEQLAYAAKDSAVLLPLYKILQDLIKKNELEKTARLEFMCLPAVIEIEAAGMPFNSEKAQEILTEIESSIKDLISVIEIPNINSSAQVQQKLLELGQEFISGGEFCIEGETFEVSSSDEVLSRIKARLPEDHPLATFIKSIQAYRHLKKKADMLKKWLESVHPATKRLHTSLKQINPQGVGRFSAREPNLQQISRDPEIRSLFAAEPGKKLVTADYSGIEMRIIAQLSRDRTLIKAFREGIDIHKFTASRISGKSLDEVTKEERQAAKACFSADTEILTINGWIRFDAYDGSTPVAQYILPNGITYNPKYGNKNGFTKDAFGKIEFVTPLEFKCFDTKTLMVFENEKVSLRITPNHEIIYLDYLLRPHKKPACQVKPRSINYMISAGIYENSPHLSEIETRILAMIAADGRFEKSGKYVTFKFKKEGKITRCKKLLNQANWAYTVKQFSDSKVLIKVKIPANVLHIYRYCIDLKTRELQWACLNIINGKIYLEEAQWWDSYRYATQTGISPGIYFTSIYKQTVDVMQAMAVLSGVPAVVYSEVRNNNPKYYRTGQLYYLSYALDRPPLKSIRWKPNTIESNCKVYCVQVPSGAIIVRHNGKPIICGNCNFGLIYGLSTNGLQTYSETGYGIIITSEEAKTMREGFFRVYPGIEKWHQKQASLTSEKNFKDYWVYNPEKGFVSEKRPQVRTLGGRLRVWPTERQMSSAGQTKALKKVGPVTELFNTPDQGTGADMIKLAMIILYRELYSRQWDAVRLIGCVHDELILEAPEPKAEEALELLSACMLKAAKRLLPDVPVEVEAHVADTWAEK